MDIGEEVAELLAESRRLLGEPTVKVKYDSRRTSMYRLMTSQTDFVYPAVHLWEPDSVTLSEAVIQWEPGLKGESFYVAVHGHAPHIMCGLKAQWTQLCHMAFFKPTGVEKEKFNEKWNYLYHADPGLSNPPLQSRHHDFDEHDSGGRGIQSPSFQGFSF